MKFPCITTNLLSSYVENGNDKWVLTHPSAKNSNQFMHTRASDQLWITSCCSLYGRKESTVMRYWLRGKINLTLFVPPNNIYIHSLHSSRYHFTHTELGNTSSMCSWHVCYKQILSEWGKNKRGWINVQILKIHYKFSRSHLSFYMSHV